jgi:hypothetical protein
MGKGRRNQRNPDYFKVQGQAANEQSAVEESRRSLTRSQAGLRRRAAQPARPKKPKRAPRRPPPPRSRILRALGFGVAAGRVAAGLIRARLRKMEERLVWRLGGKG